MDQNTQKDVLGNYTETLTNPEEKQDNTNRCETLDMFRFDFYKGTIGNEEILKEYSRYVRIPESSLSVRIHSIPEENQVLISEVKPWKLWTEDTKSFSEKIRSSIKSKHHKVLSGKAPNSMSFYLGYLLNTPLSIVNEFRGDFTLFDIKKGLNEEQYGGKLHLEEFASSFVKNGSTYAILFMTLDARYCLSEEQVSNLGRTMAEKGYNCDMAGYYRLSPVNQEAKPLFLCSERHASPNNPNIVSLEDIKVDIFKAYEKLKLCHKGFIIITTGPQPMSYIAGMIYKPVLCGDIVLLEMTGPFKYEIAYSS